MNDTATPPDNSPGPHSSPEAAALRTVRSQRVVDYLSRMSVGQMTLALVLAVFVWQWFDAHRQIDAVQQELARRLSDMEGSNKASQVLVSQSQEALYELSRKVVALESLAAEAQSQRAALETLYQQMSSSRDETALAEIEQMLMIAAQQLQLSANVKAALTAMQQADAHLQRLDRPSLNSLRKAVNSDMDRLRALPTIDTAGITVRLDNLIAATESLPLHHEVGGTVAPLAATPTMPDESGWQRLWREIWHEARNLVRIEDMRQREMPLISPTEAFFLRENLKLRLLSARFALLSRDEISFRSDIKTAQDWVRRYFDATSVQGKRALVTLQQLGASDIAIEMPDINASIEAVRLYRASHEKAGR